MYRKLSGSEREEEVRPVEQRKMRINESRAEIVKSHLWKDGDVHN